MRPLAIACYVLAVLGLALSAQVGWAAAVVAVAALAAAVVLLGLEQLRTRGLMDTAQALAEARSEASQAREDVKRLRTEWQATLERLRKPQGY